MAATDDSGRTALHPPLCHPVQSPAEAVTMLLAAGADPNARDQRQRTPLHAATELLGKKKKTGNSAFIGIMLEAYYNKEETMAELLAAGAEAGAADAEGTTPLHLLADFLTSVAATFDTEGGTYNETWPDVPGWVCMARAASVLVAAGADVNAAERGGRTVRDAFGKFFAAFFGEPAAAALLAPPPAAGG